MLGQGIAILASPLLSRIYRPEDFGILAVYSSLLGIFAVVAGGRYELAIPIPEKEEEAEGLLKISLGFVALTSLIAALLVFFLGSSFSTFAGIPSLAPFLWLLPLGILLSGCYHGLSYLILRRKGFPVMARTRVVQGVGMSGIQLLLGALKVRPLGLILGQIVGQGAGITSLWREARKSGSSAAQPSMSSLSLAKRYQRFPLLSTWGGLFNVLSIQLPVILLSALFGPTMTGFYALGLRVIHTPLALFGNAIGQVFFSEASPARREGRLAEVVEKGFSRLLPLGCWLLLPLAVTAPETFSLIFGSQWRTAGCYAQMLVPWLLLVFVNSPLSTLTTVLERQGGELIFQSSLLFVRLGALLFGRYLGGASAALGAFAFVSALWWGGYTIWNLGLVNVKTTRIADLFKKAVVPTLPLILLLLILKAVYPSGKEKEIVLAAGTAIAVAAGLFREGKVMFRG